MKEFFKNIWLAIRHINESDKHQKVLFIGSFIVYMLLGIVFGYVSSIIFTLALGFAYEVTYCYVPYTDKKIWKWTVKLPDYNKFKGQLKELNTKEYHRFNKKNMYFNVAGIFIGVIFIVIMLFFLKN